ncbi:SPRY domain-containing protein [Kiloniella majae]|uniref:SPRY domain-containing protein n=1 Tax=Kiloniella majae TaxID=1938558 RepID=UPI000A2782A6|nr:SPRY domain-containing protein [Kiloniella majae]
MRALYSGTDGWQNDLEASLVLNNNSYLRRVPTVTGNRRQFTILMNIRRINHDQQHWLVNAGTTFYYRIRADGKIEIGGVAAVGAFISDKVIRDTEWFFLGAAYDSVARTIKVVMNDEELTGALTLPSANYQTNMNLAGANQDIGTYNNNTSKDSNYCISDVVILDGEVLTPQEMINYRTQNVPFGNNVITTTKRFTTEGQQERFYSLATNDPAQITNNVINDESQYIYRASTSWSSVHTEDLPRTGKYLVEITALDVEDVQAGVAPSSHKNNTTYIGYPWSGAAGAYFARAAGLIAYNAGVLESPMVGAPASSSRVGGISSFCIDMDAKKLYFAYDGVFVTGQDPAAGTGGYIFSGDDDFKFYVSLYAMLGARVNFGQADYKCPVAGYGPLKEPAKSNLKRCKLFPFPNRALSGLRQRQLWIDEASGSWWSAYSNFVLNKGKIYIEFTNQTSDVNSVAWGMTNDLGGINTFASNATFGNANANSIGMYLDAANHYHQEHGNTGSWPTNVGGGKWFGAQRSDETTKIAIDFDAGLWWYGSDDEWVGDPALGTGGLTIPTGRDWKLWVSAHTYGGGLFNFGDSPWEHTPPTGFKGPAEFDFDSLRPLLKDEFYKPTENTLTLSNGNLTVDTNGTNTWPSTYSKNTMKTGKYYGRFIMNAPDHLMIGIAGPITKSFELDTYTRSDAYGMYFQPTDGPRIYRAGSAGSIYSPNPSAGDVAEVFVDLDAKLMWQKVNGTLIFGDNEAGTGAMGLNANNVEYSWWLGAYRNGSVTWDVNAVAPAGWQALNAETAYQPEREYGPNGTQLLFEDGGNLGKSSAGNLVPWSLTGITSEDQLTDTPGDPYPILSTIMNGASGISHGGTRLSASGVTRHAQSSMPMSSGKWYWEVTISGGANPSQGAVGIVPAGAQLSGAWYINEKTYGYYGYNGTVYSNNVQGSTGLTYTTGDVIGVALDLDTNEIEFFKNNASRGKFLVNAEPSYVAAVGQVSSASGSNIWDINFGQKPFTYPIPTGFKELKGSNRETPKHHGRDKFDVLLRYSDNTETKVYPAVKPAVVWTKSRNGAYSNSLYDVLRGAGKYLRTDTTNAEGDYIETLKLFEDDGYTLGTSNESNRASNNYVDWVFGLDGTEVTNNDGTIPSQVIADSSGYMSIAKYVGNQTQGATYGHGLDDIPEFVIAKALSGATGWVCWHKDLATASYGIFLNSNASQNNPATDYFERNIATDLVMGLGANDDANDNGPMLTYNFKSVKGLSKVFSYDGNSNTNGPHVALDFKARFVMIKAVNNSTHWYIIDTERNTINEMKTPLYANLSNVEGSWAYGIDVTANGITIRQPAGYGLNNAGITYIGLAIADLAGGGNLPAILGN